MRTRAPIALFTLYAALIPSCAFVISGDELSDIQYVYCHSVVNPKLVIGANNDETADLINYHGCYIETSVSNISVQGNEVLVRTNVGSIKFKIDNFGILITTGGCISYICLYVFFNCKIYRITPNYVEVMNTGGNIIKKYKNPYLHHYYQIYYYKYQLSYSKCQLTLYVDDEEDGYIKLIQVVISNNNVKFYVTKANELILSKLLKLSQLLIEYNITDFTIFHGINGYTFFVLTGYEPKGFDSQDASVGFGFSQLLTRVLLAMIIKFLISDNNFISLAKYLPFNIVVYTYVPGFNKLISESYPELLLDCAIAALLDLTTKIIAIYYIKTISSITKIFGDILGLLANNIPFMGIFNILSTMILKPILDALGIPCYGSSEFNMPLIVYISSNCEEVAVRVQKECYDVPMYYSAVTFAIGETLSRILIGYVKVTSPRDVFNNLAEKIFYFNISSVLPYPVAVECHFLLDSSDSVVRFDHPVLDYIVDNLYLLLHGYVSLPEIIDLTWLTIECHLIKLLTGVDLLWPCSVVSPL